MRGSRQCWCGVWRSVVAVSAYMGGTRGFLLSISLSTLFLFSSFFCLHSSSSLHYYIPLLLFSPFLCLHSFSSLHFSGPTLSLYFISLCPTLSLLSISLSLSPFSRVPLSPCPLLYPYVHPLSDLTTLNFSGCEVSRRWQTRSSGFSMWNRVLGRVLLVIC